MRIVYRPMVRRRVRPRLPHPLRVPPKEQLRIPRVIPPPHAVMMMLRLEHRRMGLPRPRRLPRHPQRVSREIRPRHDVLVLQ